MASRIAVVDPAPREESRQLAEAVADIHYVVGIIVENADELLPGESVDEMNRAWEKSAVSFNTLVSDLLPSGNRDPKIKHESLVEAELTGDVGRAKKGILARLRDRFLSWWNSKPRTDEKRAKSSEAAGEYLELASLVVGSIPGHEQIVELLSLIKLLLGLRAKRELEALLTKPKPQS